MDTELPGEGREWHFRDIPDQELLDSILIAAGRAACQMPKITDFSLRYELNPVAGLSFRPDLFRDKVSCVEIMTEQVPELSKETEDIWKEACEKHGREYSLTVADYAHESESLFHYSHS
jgi:hypothetical protein